jgi:hypothetical protein
MEIETEHRTFVGIWRSTPKTILKIEENLLVEIGPKTVV